MKYKLSSTKCKRCGKNIMSSNKSLHGANETHAKYSGICSECITPEERKEIEDSIAEALNRR